MTPERYRRICETLDRRQPDLTVIMDGVHKPHNIAAIVRTCDAVGILDVHAILPKNRARVAAGTAMGSQRWVKVHKHEDSTPVIRELQGQGVQVLAAHLSDTAIPYREVDYSKPTALLLGTEKFGVSDEAAAAVDQHVIIPMMGMVESFNVSVAAAIILSEACEQRRAKGFYEQPQLDPARYQELLFRWGHEKIARLCDAHGVPYPELDEEGQVKDSAALTALLQKSD
ncbi:tRNA (guanosine(18)-2'-O)-methyltransferase TrmH [Alcanivorax sp. S6407]|uniref:tRNA (guanosine(18)-2'-O)-methyltransferase TrmH n=1 Tax=Alcanivorax sp. S6407 TaxID=2926424 RepID=UPI001FF12A5F|nr:tRNA (guanosine(18)-2'-O)-methyltransferase TrmH [Alcanivorax sp. S6407]MCK0153037.1 tRNA (guanosine(18)-2'-O)-methyltransferase TrmH [Alcanivorax sp. S6407]